MILEAMSWYLGLWFSVVADPSSPESFGKPPVLRPIIILDKEQSEWVVNFSLGQNT